MNLKTVYYIKLCIANYLTGTPAPNLNKMNTVQPICTVDSFHFSSDETVSNL